MCGYQKFIIQSRQILKTKRFILSNLKDKKSHLISRFLHPE